MIMWFQCYMGFGYVNRTGMIKLSEHVRAMSWAQMEMITVYRHRVLWRYVAEEWNQMCHAGRDAWS